MTDRKPKELTLRVMCNEASLVIAGLLELPAKHSVGLLMKLREQIAEQEKDIDDKQE